MKISLSLSRKLSFVVANDKNGYSTKQVRPKPFFPSCATKSDIESRHLPFATKSDACFPSSQDVYRAIWETFVAQLGFFGRQNAFLCKKTPKPGAANPNQAEETKSSNEQFYASKIPILDKANLSTKNSFGKNKGFAVANPLRGANMPSLRAFQVGIRHRAPAHDQSSRKGPSTGEAHARLRRPTQARSVSRSP
ncbi:MAG: hypothetical protein Q4B69_07970 [Slackia sp.]|nr:hypothetical protein [Slackia sp.]